jgi:glycine oxidase
MTSTHDVIIAGAGIIGSSIAFELASRGVRVAVFDRQQPGLEASWAAAGMLSPPPDSPSAIPLVPLASASLALYPNFIAAVEESSGQHCNYRAHGAIEAFFSGDAERHLSTLVALHHGLGLPTEVLRPEEALKLEPALNRDLRAAAFMTFEACVDNRALTSAVIAAAKARGAEFHTNRRIEAIIREENRCAGIIADGERIYAATTIIAAGCFSANIAGAEKYAPVKPVRGQMVALRSSDVDLKYVLRGERGYIVPRGNGLCVAGSTLENVGFEKRVTPAGIERILAMAQELVPALAGAEIAETWSGLRPDSPDHLPLLGPADVEGLVIATGHYRNGILLTPITAKLIAEWLTEKRASFAWDDFSPLRFTENETLGSNA